MQIPSIPGDQFGPRGRRAREIFHDIPWLVDAWDSHGRGMSIHGFQWLEYCPHRPSGEEIVVGVHAPNHLYCEQCAMEQLFACADIPCRICGQLPEDPVRYLVRAGTSLLNFYSVTCADCPDGIPERWKDPQPPTTDQYVWLIEDDILAP